MYINKRITSIVLVMIMLLGYVQIPIKAEDGLDYKIDDNVTKLYESDKTLGQLDPMEKVGFITIDDKTGIPIFNTDMFQWKKEDDRFIRLPEDDYDNVFVPNIVYDAWKEKEIIGSESTKVTSALNDKLGVWKDLKDKDEYKDMFNEKSGLHPMINKQLAGLVQALSIDIGVKGPLMGYRGIQVEEAWKGGKTYFYGVGGLKKSLLVEYSIEDTIAIDTMKDLTSKVKASYQKLSGISNSKYIPDDMGISVTPNSNSDKLETSLYLGSVTDDTVNNFKELSNIPFDRIFTSEDMWKSKSGKVIRSMLKERLDILYVLGELLVKTGYVEDPAWLKEVSLSYNRYMELKKEYDKVSLEPITDNKYGLKYRVFDGEVSSEEGKSDTLNTMSDSQKEEVTEALDKYPGIWDYDKGFTEAYKGLFAWTAAFTPFKTNIFDGNNRQSLTPGQRELISTYGANRSILYKAKGASGVLKNIADGEALNFEAISLAEFIQKAPTEEIGLFVRHEASRLVIDTQNKVEEITGVEKEPAKSQADKDADDLVQINKGSNDEKLPENLDKTPVSDIKEEVGSFKVGETEELVFLGPFYTSSGQYGKDIISLDDASQTRFLKGSAWSNNSLLDQIQSYLEGKNTSQDNQAVKDAMGVIKGEIKDARSAEEAKKILGGTKARAFIDTLTGQKFDEFLKDTNKYLDKLIGGNDSEVIKRANELDKIARQKYQSTLESQLQKTAGTITGNQANMNYVWMFNSLIDGKPEFGQLEEDMQKPLYVDFLGNITTHSGVVVVPAAANANLYSPGPMIMANAMFLNGYPDIKMDEKDYYGIASKVAKRKYIMTQLEGGLLRYYRPLMGDKTLGTGNEIFTLPVVSTISEAPASEGENSPKKIDLINYIKDFKDSSEALFKGMGVLDINSKIFVNNGAVINRITGNGMEAVNTKKISTAGGYTDWNLIQKLNQTYINVEKPLNELKLVQLILSSQTQKDQLKDVKLSKYMSETSMLRNNRLTKFFGSVFEGVNDKLLSKMDKNFLMYTPTQDKLPIFRNSGMYTQRMMLFLVLFMFVIITIRFAVMVISKQSYRAKPLFISLVALILIAGFNLYLFNPLINLVFNKPADKLLEDMTPVYILEMAENSYKDQDIGFFSDNADKDPISPGNPSLTLEKLHRETIASLRAQGDKTGELADALYSPTLDQTKLRAQGEHLYVQGRELKIDVDKLFNNYNIMDVQGFNGVHLDVTVTRGVEANNYMPYLQFLKTLTNRINKNSISTYPPLNRIQYRRGMSKTTGRAESYFNSIVFIDYEKIKDLKETLENQYQMNLEEMTSYTTDYVRQQVGMKMIDNEMVKAVRDPSYIPGGVNRDPKTGKMVLTDDQIKFVKKRAEVMKTLDKLEERFKEVKQFDEIDNVDWLGLRFILGIEENEEIIPKGTEQSVFMSRWYPLGVRTEEGELINEDRTWEKIVRINDDTKRFVLKKIAPIAGSVSDDTVIKTVSLYAMMQFNKEFSIGEKELYPKYINTEGLSNEFVTRASLIPRDEIFISKYSQVSEYLALKTGWIGLAFASFDRIAYTLRMILRLFLITFTILAVPIMSLWYYVMSGSKNMKYLKGVITNILILSMLYIAEIMIFKLNNILIGKISTTATLMLDTVFQVSVLMGYIWLTKNILSNLASFGFDGLKDKFGTLLNGQPITSSEIEMAADLMEDDFESDYDDLVDPYENYNGFFYEGDKQRGDSSYDSVSADLDTMYHQEDEDEYDGEVSEVITEEEQTISNKKTAGISGESELDDGVDDSIVGIADEDTAGGNTPKDLSDVEDRNELVKFLENRNKDDDDENRRSYGRESSGEEQDNNNNTKSEQEGEEEPIVDDDLE